MVQWFKQPIFDSRDYDSGWFRAGQSSDSKFQDPARKIMEFLVGDEILGFVDELLFFLWWIQWIHEKCGIGIYQYLGRFWRFLRPRFTEIPRITELQKSEIRRAVRVEDLHRASDLGISAKDRFNHTNDEADMEVKHGASHLFFADPGWYGYPTLVMKHGQPPQRSMIVQ